LDGETKNITEFWWENFLEVGQLEYLEDNIKMDLMVLAP
jgi:hypothetical protein